MKTIKASDKTGIFISTFYFISVVVAVRKQYFEIRCRLDNYSCRCQNFTSFWCRLACVASVSVGFQSRERSKNEVLIILPRKKWERVKKWSEGEGEGNERNACQQRSVFCKTPQSSFCRNLSTGRASMTTTSCHKVANQNPIKINKVIQVSLARVSVGFQSRERPKFFGLSL